MCRYAVRDVKAGEVLEVYEERAHYLVTKAHVDAKWTTQMKGWFGSYAYPLIGDTYVMWSDKPTDWRPINHSCDPNLWFGADHSLNVYARRAIARGEELTMDYATFCAGEYMADFPCACGAAACRGTVTGADYGRHPELRARYGTRVTHYVWLQGPA